MDDPKHEIRDLVAWFKKDLGYCALELHDEAWADFADQLVGIVTRHDATPATALDPNDPNRIRAVIDYASAAYLAAEGSRLDLSEDAARNLLVAAGWIAGAAAGELGLVLDKNTMEPLC